MDNLHELEGEKGLFKLSSVYIHRKFIVLEHYIMELDNKEDLKGVVKVEECSSDSL